MQTYDVIMLVVLGIATFLGAIKGFAWQIASIASILVSYFVACTFRTEVAKVIHAQEPWNSFLAMLLIYAGSSFAIWVVFRLVSSTIDQFRLRDFDRHMGALLGAGKGILFCVLITMFAVSLLGPRQQQSIINSRSGGYIAQILSATNGIMLPKEIEPIVRPYLNGIEQKFDQRSVNNSQSGPSTNDTFLGGLLNPQNNSPSSGSAMGSGSLPGNNPFESQFGNGSQNPTLDPGTIGSWLNKLAPGTATQNSSPQAMPSNIPSGLPTSLPNGLQNTIQEGLHQLNSLPGFSNGQQSNQGQGGQTGFGFGAPSTGNLNWRPANSNPTFQPIQPSTEFLP